MMASARRCRVARLLGEAAAELRGGVVAVHDEEIVEGRDGVPHTDVRQALIQSVE